MLFYLNTSNNDVKNFTVTNPLIQPSKMTSEMALKYLDWYGVLSSPTWPKQKKNNKVRTSSAEHLEKETILGL